MGGVSFFFFFFFLPSSLVLLKRLTTPTATPAMGLDMDSDPPSTWGDTLASLNPFSRPSSRADERDGEGKLPAVDPRLVPQSSDPMGELERQIAEELEPEEPGMDAAMDEDEGEDEDDEMFGPRGVDVAMTGMGEPWMAGRFM